jgi:hypothetical protein
MDGGRELEQLAAAQPILEARTMWQSTMRGSGQGFTDERPLSLTDGAVET